MKIVSYAEYAPKDGYFYGVGDPDQLEGEIEDCIEYHLESIHPDLPDTIEVEVYERDEPDVESWARGTLDLLLERLDETYGDPDALSGNSFEATEAQQKAAEDFLRAVLKECSVWSCHRVGLTVVVPVREWLRDRDPEWLEILERSDK